MLVVTQVKCSEKATGVQRRRAYIQLEEEVMMVKEFARKAFQIIFEKQKCIMQLKYSKEGNI